jgi:CheY-like chemotaxis protein
LAEDVGEVLELTRLVLEMKGMEVAVATNGADALALGGHRAFDVAVVDYILGQDNGALLARDLKAAQPGLKVVLTSGTDVIPPEEMAFADAYYMKGDFSVADLADLIHQLLGRFKDRKAG